MDRSQMRVGRKSSFAKLKSLIGIGASMEIHGTSTQKSTKGTAKFPTGIRSASFPSCLNIPKVVCHRDQPLHVSLENIQSENYQLPAKTTKHLIKCSGHLES